MNIISNLSWISWIIFGALAGWVASILTGRNSRQGCIGNIIVGIIGAFLGDGPTRSSLAAHSSSAGTGPPLSWRYLAPWCYLPCSTLCLGAELSPDQLPYGSKGSPRTKIRRSSIEGFIDTL